MTARMRAGVTVVDPATTWIDVDVELAPDVTVLPGTQLLGATRVAGGATVGPDSTLTDSRSAPAPTSSAPTGGPRHRRRRDGRPVLSSGPARPRRGGKIGAFVETKNAVIGDGVKVPHLSYVGDAEIGEDTNIGAATVFVNYDGVRKHRTVVGDHVRIGSDNMLIAPVTIGDGAYTGAGSVIDQDVPPGALGVARASRPPSRAGSSGAGAGPPRPRRPRAPAVRVTAPPPAQTREGTDPS